jgi:hypothetical protein
MKGERLERSTDADPYRALALAILQQAVDDARGRRTHLSGNAKQNATQAARCWLLAGAGGLPALFDIDHGALIAALGLGEGVARVQEFKKNRQANGAKI